MKISLLALTFFLLAFTIFKILYVNEDSGVPSISFPTFEPPDITFIDVSGGCGGFIDCTEYLANVIFNIGAGIIFLVQFIIELVVYIVQFFAVLIQVQFIGIDGAPWFINLLLATPISVAIGLILFKMFRSGASET